MSLTLTIFSCPSEVAGFVFFGSSLGILHRIMDEVGLESLQEEEAPLTPFLKSPHTPTFLMMKDRQPFTPFKPAIRHSLPKYLALDLTRLHNLDGTFWMQPLSSGLCLLPKYRPFALNLQRPLPVAAFCSSLRCAQNVGSRWSRAEHQYELSGCCARTMWRTAYQRKYE